MKKTVIGLLVSLVPALALPQSVDFDSDAAGSPPSGWTCGVTGGGHPRWAVATEPDAPSNPNVLLQTGSGTFPWCVKDSAVFADGFVEVKFKPISGREDQAGGLMWRWKDGNHYYVARANARENNVSLYYTERGSRKTLKYVDAPVARGTWHTLRIEFAGSRIEVWLDGRRYIELHDSHITGPGAVGVWTKADSVTVFNDFTYQAKP
jgi:hypothetical protein